MHFLLFILVQLTITLVICAWGDKKKSMSIHRELHLSNVTAQHFKNKSDDLKFPTICLNQNVEVPDSKQDSSEI